MSRSLKIRPDYIEFVNLTVKHYGFTSQKALAEDRNISLSTVNKFLRGKPIDSTICVELCHLLELDTRAITESGKGKVFFPKPIEAPKPLQCCKPRLDWGEAIAPESFHGRTADLAILQQWVLTENKRLISILGMEGIGKTTLSMQLAHQIKPEFDALIWRSLSNVTTLEALLQDLIRFLSNQSDCVLPETIEALVPNLLQQLRNQRCLIILDRFDVLFQEHTYASCYKEDCIGYGYLLKAIAESTHHSCVVLTSREKPKEVALLEGDETSVRTLQLQGLTPIDGKEIFRLKGCFGSDEQHWQEIFERYAGNPLALRTVAAAIQEIFSGNILALILYLRKEKFLFSDITDVLERHFQRLLPMEQKILYWLAMSGEPVSLEKLTANHLHSDQTPDLFEAVRSLRRRGLVELREQTLLIHPVFAQYVTYRLIDSGRGRKENSILQNERKLINAQ